MTRLALLTSHPIQYQAPLFRELAKRLDLTVYFAHRARRTDQAAAGFDVDFDWDVDLVSGFNHHFLENRSKRPGLDYFGGCDTPSIATELSVGRFDAFLVMGWYLKSFWQGIWSAKRARIPVLVRGDSHLDTPRSLVKKVGKSFVYPFALRVFDSALYVGERSRQYWQHYGYPADRLLFSPHCVDNAWFAQRVTVSARNELRRRYAIPSDAAVALFAGKLIPLKRPLDLIAAARVAMKSIPNLTVLIAGSGLLADQVARSAEQSGVRLVHLGFCNQSMMPSVYAAADVLVLPSERETWGLVCNEALACGRPIIVSDACGCALDLVADGTAGSIFPAGNVSALADALVKTLEGPPRKEDLARRAAAYSVEAAAGGVCNAIAAALHRKGVAS